MHPAVPSIIPKGPGSFEPKINEKETIIMRNYEREPIIIKKYKRESIIMKNYERETIIITKT